MIENIDLYESMNVMNKLNVVIYGTIRDIEENFLKSFINIELLCNFFNNVYIIIFENDSIDNTRNLLKEWSSSNNSKIKKHIILEDNVNIRFPLRAHRLAYCRNVILNYIFSNNLDIHYQYAIHCDLDDRFWSLDFNSISNCFQYNLENWDAMFPINKNKYDYNYYDFWALRCDDCWFNKNIFCCDANPNTPDTYDGYVNHIPNLLKFIKNNDDNLIKVNSAFNGLGIYKLKSLKNCQYNADYICNTCFGKKRGCVEDNDHIGLHKKMVLNKCNLFINKNMFVTFKETNYINYSEFVNNLSNVTNIYKNPLKYVLYNKLLDTNYLWLNFSYDSILFDNIISNYTEKNIFSFQINNNNCYSSDFTNKNVIKYFGNITKNINNFIINNNNSLISFMHIDFNNYHYTKIIFEKLYNKINDECIIVFNKFINFHEYLLNDLNAFYEFTQIYGIIFEYIGMNGTFCINPTNNNKNTEIIIKIIKNPYFNYYNTSELFLDEDIYINFHWKKYISMHDDLKHVKNKIEAWEHWNNHGKKEGRIYILSNNLDKDNLDKDNNLDKDDEYFNFDWKNYVNNYDDLKHMDNKEEAWTHWNNHGKNEGRTYISSNDEYSKFDWKNYVNNYDDLKDINNKEEAWDHWNNYGKNENRMFFSEKCLQINNFDWKFYVTVHNDLKHINNKQDAWYHWITYGKSENRLFKKKIKKEKIYF